jgi:hypothetical protein
MKVYLSASITAIKDMNSRSLTVVTSKKATALTADNVPPVLEAWAFNLNSRTVTLSFSETVRADSLEPTAFVLQVGTLSAGANSMHPVVTGVKSATNSHILSFVFSETDANDIKIKTALCTDETDCTVRVFRQTFALEDAIEFHAFALLQVKRAGVWPMLFLSGVHSSYRFTL